MPENLRDGIFWLTLYMLNCGCSSVVGSCDRCTANYIDVIQHGSKSVNRQELNCLMVQPTGCFWCVKVGSGRSVFHINTDECSAVERCCRWSERSHWSEAQSTCCWRRFVTACHLPRSLSRRSLVHYIAVMPDLLDPKPKNIQAEFQVPKRGWQSTPPHRLRPHSSQVKPSRENLPFGRCSNCSKTAKGVEFHRRSNRGTRAVCGVGRGPSLCPRSQCGRCSAPLLQNFRFFDNKKAYFL